MLRHNGMSCVALEQIIVLGSIFFINKSGINFEEPDTLQILRMVYCFVKAVEVLVYVYLYTALQQKTNAGDEDYTKKKMYFPGPSTPFNPAPKYNPIPSTVSDHEQAKIKQVPSRLGP